MTWIETYLRDGIKMLLNMSSIALLYTTIHTIFLIRYIVDRFKRNEDVEIDSYVFKSKTANIISVAMFIMGLLYLPFCLFNAGNTTFGSIFEKKYYTENFYVYITDNHRSAKYYKTKATIEKTSSGITEDYYILKRIYLKNGKCIDFSDNDNIGERVYPNEETHFVYNDNDYYVTLTAEKVK